MDFAQQYQALIDGSALNDDPAQRRVLPQFQRIADGFAQPAKRGLFHKASPPPKGLYLWGGVGRGKSMLMDLFVQGLDVPVRRVHFHGFMQEIHAAMHETRKQGVDDAILPVADAVADAVRCLAFDEMQITDITDAMIVGRLFERLFERGVVVVTTSNRVPTDLYKDGLNRALFLPFIDLLRDQMEVVKLSSDTDYRQSRLSGRPVWFTPLGAAARAQMDVMFDQLAGGKGEAMILQVKGRAVEIPQARNGVGRTAFHALCGAALGPADYLAVAAAFRVLFLDDIPTLSRSNFNEAKRFVTLIDTLYEANVQLIASAAAQPDYLYLEGEGVFEFARTASRLAEMQSDGWGQPKT